MQKSACDALNLIKLPQSRGSIWPLASMRNEVGLRPRRRLRAEELEKLGHIRDVGSRDRHAPQPWQAEAVSIKVKSGQRRAGSITGSSSGRSIKVTRGSPSRRESDRGRLPLESSI